MNDDDPFAGVWMGGFEGADHVNSAGERLDLAAASGHLDRLDEDHRRAAQAGVRCVRESIGWRLAESSGGSIDLSRAVRIAQSARRHGLQVLWTLMHYGLPDDLCLHDDAMIGRFERFAAEVARVVGAVSERPPVYTPVNEIGFLAWAASLPAMFDAPNNMAGADPESSRISGYTVKRRLSHAAIRAVWAMRRVDPRARFVHIEPMVHVVPPRDRPDLADAAEQVRNWQWQGWDLISGRLEPELGGTPDALDMVGINHYHTSQWEFASEQRLDWHGREPRRRPFSALLGEAWQRYGRPLLVAETSHVGIGRTAWLNEIAAEVRRAGRAGVPVRGICLYPLVDRPDWGEPQRWHRSGLFHVPGSAQALALAGVPPLVATAAAGAALQAVAPGAASSGEAANGVRRPQPLSRFAEPDYLAALRAWQVDFARLDGHEQARVAGDAQGADGEQGAAPSHAATRPHAAPVLLAFSHLRWDFMRHRMRQLLSRLARQRRVVFVEEPLFTAGPARLDRIVHGPSIEVLVPYTASLDTGFTAAQQPLLQGLLQDWLAAEGIRAPTAWLCTPMACPLAQALRPGALVYDCSDELSGFIGAPPALARHEAALLGVADLVFTAGPSLAVARRRIAAERLQLLPNGVDARHFAPRRVVAGSWDAEEAGRLQAAVPATAPRLGFAGVVDERFDLPLLAALAEQRPQWQFVIAGPVLKIDADRLPRRPNIHWLGPVPWRVLPAMMASWQVGLLPFARNAATLHANPLKVLEYLAAALPVVATPLADLPRLPVGGSGHGAVTTALGAAAFVLACDAALAESAAQGAARRRSTARWARRHDWHAIAASAARHLADAERAASLRRASSSVAEVHADAAADFDTGVEPFAVPRAAVDSDSDPAMAPAESDHPHDLVLVEKS